MKEMSPQFFDRTRVGVRALFVGKRIDTRGLDRKEVVSHVPLTFAVGDLGYAVVFRYGAVVFFDVPLEEEKQFLERLSEAVRDPRDEPETESLLIAIEEGMPESIQGNLALLPELNMLSLHVVADILGKSVVLDFYEKRVARSFDSIEPLAQRLRKRGRRGVRVQGLLQHIAEVLIDLQYMVGRVEVIEKPEFLWERPDMERFFALLEDEFEIRERHIALERKLELISRTAQTVLDVVQTKRTLRVEWYIVILIVVEIVLTLYELFLHPRL